MKFRFLPEQWIVPEAAALLGTVCGIAAGRMPWATLLLPAAFVLPPKRMCLVLLFAAAGWCAWSIQYGSQVLCPVPQAVRGRVLIDDFTLCKLSDQPPSWLIRGQGRGLVSSTRPLPDMKLFVRLPKDSTLFPSVGDILSGEGVLELPSGDFGNYVRGRGLQGVLTLDSCRHAGHLESWKSCLWKFRNRLAERGLRHIRSPERRQSMASLFFGTKGGVGREDRLEMAEAGVIHLYSVSGLHVGVLAGVLLLLGRCLPFRLRYILLIPATLLYVITTGSHVPAVRAWIMIALWAGCRAGVYYLPGRTILGYTACGMLLFQPVWLFDMGFLYSFGITAVLIVLGHGQRESRQSLADPLSMMPRSSLRNAVRRNLVLRNGLLNACAACIAAFAGGAVVSLCFQMRLLPGSVAANLLLIPVVGALFPVLVCKLALGWMWVGLDRLLAGVLDFLWDIMEEVIHGCAEIFRATVTGVPPVWTIALFFAGGVLLLWPRGPRKVRIAGGILAAGMVIFWHLAMFWRPPAVLIVHGGYAEVPAVAIADTLSGVGTVVNLPDGASAGLIAKFFARYGIPEADRVMFSASRSSCIRGLGAFLSRFPVRNLVLPEKSPHDGAFRRRVRESLAEFPSVGTTENPGCLRLLALPGGAWSVRYFNPAGGLTCRVEFGLEPETLTVNGKRYDLPRTSEPETLIFELSERKNH